MAPRLLLLEMQVKTWSDKFAGRKDKALALVVDILSILSVEPSLLHLLGEPDDPVAVWKELGDQFQKKSCIHGLTSWS